MKMAQYLKTTFKILVEDKTELKSSLEVICYLCAAHFIKMIVKKAKKLTQNDKTLKTFMFCFSLLQNSTTFEEFESIFINILHMFSNEKLSLTCIDSISILRTKIRQRNLKDFSYIDFDDVDTSEEEDRKKHNEVLENINSEDSDTIKSFKKFYTIVI